MDLDDLKKICGELNQPTFRAKQIFEWIYEKGLTDIKEMSNLPTAFREQLLQHYSIDRLKISHVQCSSDGTQKWLIEFADHNKAECVHIPERTRGTLCVSSQIGCTLTCKFCHTGTQVLVRNLDAGEILGQIIAARDIFNEWNQSEKRHLTNIVMMGMGEPLYNFDHVVKALKIALLHFSRHKITLSTSGVVPKIEELGKTLRVPLAVSLHAVRNDLRDHLVPLNKKYPLEELLPVVRKYPQISQTDKVTFEYVMLKDVNDTVADAKELVRLIKGIPSKVNLIPFNPWPNAPFERSTDRQIQKFSDILERAGYASPVRTPRGEDILAACGQLKSDSERKRKCQSE